MSETELRKIIGQRLNIARKQAGLSQLQASKLLNIPRPSISEIEAGRRKVSAEELIKFTEIYHVDLNWLGGQGTNNNLLSDEIQLAARNLKKLKSEDLEKVIEFLQTIKPQEKD